MICQMIADRYAISADRETKVMFTRVYVYSQGGASQHVFGAGGVCVSQHAGGCGKSECY